ncbi:MAG: hypothetical protein ACFFCS_20005 [Candidatus Hodarchaeota archaeon]
MPKSDRICHVGTSDRPFYKFQYGRAFLYYIASILGLISGIAGTFVVFSMNIIQEVNFSLSFLIILISCIIAGFIVTRLIFFVYRLDALKAGLFTSLVAACKYLGIAALVYSFDSLVSRLATMFLGFSLVFFSWLVVVLLHRAHRRIGLFTDGIKLGNLILRYDEMEKVGFGTGPVEKSIPKEEKDKPVEILTPIEFDFEGKDFIIHHVYLIIVTAKKVLIAQSITRQSNLAQDVRNSWVVYLYSKGIKTKRNIYFEERMEK